MIELFGAELHEEGADDRGEHAGTADEKRQQHHAAACSPSKKIEASTMVATTVTA